MSVHWPIIKKLLTNPTRVAVHDDIRSYKAIELLLASQHIARLIRRDCKARHVGLMLPTSGLFPIAAIGAWSAGRAIVPLNYLLKPDELQYVVNDSETDIVITSRKLVEHIGHVPDVERVVYLEDMNFKKLPMPVIPARAKPSDLAALVYTSGTSGKPKGVMLSHGAVAANARQGAEHMGMRPTDHMLGVLPQFHCYGMTQLTITPLMAGVPVTYTARFVPNRLVKLIKERGATVTVGIPSMFNAISSLKKAGPEDLASLRLIVSGAEPLPSAVSDKFFAKFNKRLHEGYGMTEMAPATHCCLPEDCRIGSVGHPLPDVEQRIVDPATGNTLPAGESGEIRLRGPNKMDGYYKLPEITAETFDADGFYRTGDLGKIDDDGYLYITGRIKEMMIVGGENVFPREIEDAINKHPAVHDSGVTGVPDDMRGEVPEAFVELEDGAEVSEQELVAHCREQLAGYKVPKRIHIVAGLPRSPTGKILRRELRPMLELDAGAATESA